MTELQNIPTSWNRTRADLDAAHAAREAALEAVEAEEAAGGGAVDRLWQAVDDSHDRLRETLDRIADTPARSQEALAVKARAVRLAFAEELRGAGADVALLRSLLADLDGRAA